MSTRCQIGFYGLKKTDLQNPEALIYRHSDGYPDGVLPDLLPFLKRFNKVRGLDDTEYACARCIQHLTNLADERLRKWDGKNGFDKINQQWYFLSYGVCNHGFHGDIEYYYAVFPDKLEVYEVNFSYGEKEEIKKFSKKIKTIKL